MPDIRISKDVRLNEYLINNTGQRVDKIRLDGSFVINEYDNEEFIYFSRDTESWYLDIAGIIGTSTLGSLSDVILNNEVDFNVLCYDALTSTWQNCDLITSITDNYNTSAQNTADILEINNTLDNLSDFKYETVDGNTIPAIASNSYDVLIRNSDNTGYEWVPIGKMWGILKEIEETYGEGITETLNFNGTAPGDVLTLTIKNGIITGRTLVP